MDEIPEYFIKNCGKQLEKHPDSKMKLSIC
jgi:hypothetical protein